LTISFPLTVIVILLSQQFLNPPQPQNTNEPLNRFFACKGRKIYSPIIAMSNDTVTGDASLMPLKWMRFRNASVERKAWEFLENVGGSKLGEEN
jgi:hypothetical protein